MKIVFNKSIWVSNLNAIIGTTNVSQWLKTNDKITFGTAAWKTKSSIGNGEELVAFILITVLVASLLAFWQLNSIKSPSLLKAVTTGRAITKAKD